jgi:histidinol-phosphate aminotransferase
VPGEQPKIDGLVKLNTNECPYGPSEKVLAAIAGQNSEALRLYPDPQASALKAAIARRHGLAENQVFVGNGSDEVLAHIFMGLLRHEAPLLFPDISYSFYPVYAKLYGIATRAIPLAGTSRCGWTITCRRGRTAASSSPTPTRPPACRCRWPRSAACCRATPIRWWWWTRPMWTSVPNRPWA